MAVLRPEQDQSFIRKRLGLENESKTSKRRLEEDYGLNQRLINQDSVRAQHDAADQAASQGIYHSGIRVNAQGQIQREASQALSDLNLSRSRGLEDIATNLATGLAELDFQRSQALAEANRAEQAERLQRAMLQAQSQGSMVGGVGYPNPNIAFGGAQGAIAGMPQFQGNGPFRNYYAFSQANPQLANILQYFSGGNLQQAIQQAIRSGYVMQTPTIAHPGIMGYR